MAFDADLVERVRDLVVGTDGLAELKMFGGWCVTVKGNMAVGVMGDDLIVRVGPDAFDRALTRPGARPFDFTGRPMTGWVVVSRDVLATTRTLERWVALGVAFAAGLAPKVRSTTTRRGAGAKKASAG
ncbi:MAG TPA: TfoX/Sxy family protein [Acidimicrobiales bacterium]|nr:TfoX/Sxy family protein [Acidimicrobiales bacterium]